MKPKADLEDSFTWGTPTKTTKKLTNGAILIVSKVLKQVMSSAAEAEIGAVFINAKEGAVLRQHWRNWDTIRPPHQWKLTIPLPHDKSMVQSNKNVQKPWI
jgi:hypothetical protein